MRDAIKYSLLYKFSFRYEIQGQLKVTFVGHWIRLFSSYNRIVEEYTVSFKKQDNFDVLENVIHKKIKIYSSGQSSGIQ